MRPISFRDGVLYPAAWQAGLDPTRDFQSNQMLALVAFINLFVARFWDKADFPEWTTIEPRTPINHIVEYEAIGANPIWRVLKVYILDPTSTLAPCDTPFRLLDVGVHCGFDHGSTVWIKYLQPPPKFSGALWDATVTYNAGDVVYLAETGECYSSIGNNNLGNYPGPVGRQMGIPVQITQQATAGDPGLPETDEIMVIAFKNLPVPPDPPDPPTAATVFSIAIQDSANSNIGQAFQTATGAESLDDIITACAADLTGSLPAGFTVTADLTNDRITIQHNSYFTTQGGAAFYKQFSPSYVERNLVVKITQPYVPAVSSTAGLPQIVNVTFTPDLVIEGQIYELNFIDQTGDSHSVTYTAVTNDNVSQVLAGLSVAIAASTDPFFSDVTVVTNFTSSRLEISTKTAASVDATMRQPQPPSPVPNPPVPQPPTYWNYVPFPERLALQVIEGAYSAYLKMEGQTDKGMAEEQGALKQQAESVTSILAPAYDALTDQETRGVPS